VSARTKPLRSLDLIMFMATAVYSLQLLTPADD
jgi:hypothetical protein